MMARAPRFWWRTPGLACALLAPAGAVVGRITLRRMARRGATVAVPVICIGNPTVGGAGKTPTAIACLELLRARGARPFALLRGHGGTVRAPTLVEPARHTAREVGDEALLLARHAPTVVAGGDRIGGARLAVAHGASHVVMDDGFQNPTLHKDVSILVVDAAAGIGNGAVLPAGPLRAPLGPQLAGADALLLVGDGPAGDQAGRAARAAGRTVLRGRLEPDPEVVAALRQVPLFAFAGIGRPEKFFSALKAEGLAVAGERAFPDHHRFRQGDLDALVAAADRLSARLVTTEKDAVRLAALGPGALPAPVAVVPARLRLTAADGRGADAASGLAPLVALAEARMAGRRGGSAP